MLGRTVTEAEIVAEDARREDEEVESQELADRVDLACGLICLPRTYAPDDDTSATERWLLASAVESVTGLVSDADGEHFTKVRTLSGDTIMTSASEVAVRAAIARARQTSR